MYRYAQEDQTWHIHKFIHGKSIWAGVANRCLFDYLKGQPSKFVELKLYIQRHILLTKQLQLMIITLHLKWIPLLADAEEF